MIIKRRKHLRQNAEMRPLGIYNWTIPALSTILLSGEKVVTCPNAGACAAFCYARTNTYRYPAVMQSHIANLTAAMYSESWVPEIIEEVTHLCRKQRPSHLGWMSRSHLSDQVAFLLDDGSPLIRIHDAGDFFSQQYLDRWVSIAESCSQALFYAYTHEVALLKSNMHRIPGNFLVCFSMGGKQDSLIDQTRDYHAEVFPDIEAIEKAGYYSQDEHDLLCVVAPSNRIGIPQNNIPHLKKKLAGRTFGDVQQSKQRDRSSDG